MAYSRGYFINYLIHEQDVEIVNTNDYRDRIIDFKKGDLTAFLIVNLNDDIVEIEAAQRICGRLVVPLPPPEQ